MQQLLTGKRRVKVAETAFFDNQDSACLASPD